MNKPCHPIPCGLNLREDPMHCAQRPAHPINTDAAEDATKIKRRVRAAVAVVNADLHTAGVLPPHLRVDYDPGPLLDDLTPDQPLAATETRKCPSGVCQCADPQPDLADGRPALDLTTRRPQPAPTDPRSG